LQSRKIPYRDAAVLIHQEQKLGALFASALKKVEDRTLDAEDL
jgi:hypothetical protein